MRFCWIRSDLVIVIKSIKFVELASCNMLAFTNLTICINLALIIYVRRRALYELYCTLYMVSVREEVQSLGRSGALSCAFDRRPMSATVWYSITHSVDNQVVQYHSLCR